MTGWDVIVVGAGVGGLSAAIRLAARGQQVCVLEQNAHTGGKMGQLTSDGFRWDTGPSVITMRPVLDELFHSAGRNLEDYLHLLPVEPLTRYFYPDGRRLDATRDLPRMAEQITALEPRDVEGYLAYLAYAARIHRITGPVFIYNRPPTLASFTQVPPRDYLKIDPFRTMQQAIQGYVRSPHLRQLLGRFATYVGASPYLAPATLNVIAHVELMGGVWYPQGGIYAIAKALTRLAQELGVEVRTDCKVQQILIENGRTTGVVTTQGETVSARVVLANVDVATVYERLLPGSVPPNRVQRLQTAKTSCSGFILLLGVRGQHPELAHHNIFFSRDYRSEFDDIFQRGVPPDEPTIYLAITSKTDPDHAPPGCENWFVLVNSPALGSQFDWQMQKKVYRDQLINRLAAFGLDIRHQITEERCFTPLDLENLTGAQRGALYGRSSNERLAAFLRPHNRCPDVKGLYFAGGTTHPGGGVPMVILSGKVAANFILEDR